MTEVTTRNYTLELLNEVVLPTSAAERFYANDLLNDNYQSSLYFLADDRSFRSGPRFNLVRLTAAKAQTSDEFPAADQEDGASSTQPRQRHCVIWLFIS